MSVKNEVKNEVKKWEKVKCADLVIDRFQARKQNVGEGLNELAENIKKMGLLHPIIIAQSEHDPGKWEIVCGQRRYLAISYELKHEEIMAGKIEQVLTVEEGLAISASENVIREKMTTKDMQDLCAVLYKRYRSVKSVAEETSLPLPVVRKYIKYDGLPEQLKTLVDNKELNQESAQKIQLASEDSLGTYNPERGQQLLDKLKTVDDKLRGEILKVAKKNPNLSVDEVAENAERAKDKLVFNLTFLEQEKQALELYATDNDKSAKEAAQDMVEDALKQEGYLSEDDEDDGGEEE